MIARCRKAFLSVCPIKTYELKKFIPMLVIFFFVGFVYNILRNAKNALLITSQSSGAEIIPFVKVWAMLPGAILMTALFSKLSNRFSFEKVFYILVSIFLAYFALFTFVLYPNREVIHLHAFGDFLERLLPVGLNGFVSMIRYWSFTLFYVMSEMWSCIVLSLLFWGFANEVTKVDEAKRFYGLFGIGMNFSGMAAGQASIYLSKCPFSNYSPFQDPWHYSLALMTLVVIVSGLIIVSLLRWLHLKVLVEPRFYDPERSTARKKSNFKMSVRKNFAYLAKSKYLICIAVLVFGFNFVINSVEVLWMQQVRIAYPNPNDFNIYINQITIMTALIATVIALFSGWIIRRAGWTFAALITPMIMLITAIGFFACMFFNGGRVDYFGFTPLALVVFFGSAQVCLSRAGKYTVFDATKELSFIPLNEESRQKGKAAIDGIGSRVGKSGGSLMLQGMMMVFSSLAASTPYIALIVLVVIGGWMVAIKILGKEFNALTESHKVLSVEDSAPLTPAPQRA